MFPQLNKNFATLPFKFINDKIKIKSWGYEIMQWDLVVSGSFINWKIKVKLTNGFVYWNLSSKKLMYTALSVMDAKMLTHKDLHADEQRGSVIVCMKSTGFVDRERDSEFCFALAIWTLKAAWILFNSNQFVKYY